MYSLSYIQTLLFLGNMATFWIPDPEVYPIYRDYLLKNITENIAAANQDAILVKVRNNKLTCNVGESFFSPTLQVSFLLYLCKTL